MEAPDGVKKVLLIAGSGAGKTTLLSSMVDATTREFLNKRMPIRIVPDDVTNRSLATARKRLEFELRRMQPDGGLYDVLERTTVFFDFRFHLQSTRSSQNLISLDFTDSPGEYLRDRRRAEVIKKFMGSHAAIVVVDAVELIEGELVVPPGDLRRNDPELCHDIVGNWLDANRDSNLLLCIVPVKSETWLRERPGHDHVEGAKALHAAVTKSYETTLKALKQHEGRVAAVICPVQTLGNLVFDGYRQVSSAYPEETWKPIQGTETTAQPSTGYAPLDCDQPLRHIVSWLLIEQIEDSDKAQDEERGFVASVAWVAEKMGVEGAQDMCRNALRAMRDLFSEDRDLARTIARFSRGAKTTPPFSIEHGKDLLQRESNLWEFIDNFLDKWDEFKRSKWFRMFTAFQTPAPAGR